MRKTTRGAVLRASLTYAYRNRRWLRANKLKAEISEALTQANMAIGRLGVEHELYALRVGEYNRAVIESEKGKYRWGRAMDSGDSAEWRLCFKCLASSAAMARRLAAALSSGSTAPIGGVANDCALSSEGTEILFADGVPLVPEILPLVILKGSDFEMGYQYATQVIRIFGKWIFERKAGLELTEAEAAEQRRWEAEIARHAPEILGMCRGWAAGATDSGVPMSYEDVLDLWTGHSAPARLPHNLNEAGLPAELAHPFCSGLAAWGRATRDGGLVTASTGDHNPAHAVVVAAYPETGNAFIATPFHATGDIRSAPRMFMMGHPGMNDKGLAYVEHGGEPRLAEPMESWGYGIRKGTEIFHILRFASSAEEALRMELSFPVGDVGTVMGSAGGFWADRHGGFVAERRTEPAAVRRSGMLGETDFMYACNGILHPDLRDVWWMGLDPGNWRWEERGGWYTAKYRNFERGMIGDPLQMVKVSSSMIQNGNRERCRYFFDMMDRAPGRVDVEYMKMVLRRGGVPPAGDWDRNAARFAKTGEWGEVSAAHSTNTIVTVMKPDEGGEGVYCLCHGEAKRGLAPFSPKQAIYMYAETNAFWEIRLAADPEGLVARARQEAEERIGEARRLLAGPGVPAAASLAGLVAEAERELRRGMDSQAAAGAGDPETAIYDWSLAARRFTRAQVRALQASQAISPPPSRPEELA